MFQNDFRKYIALDPGETTGVAIYTQKKSPGQVDRFWKRLQVVTHQEVWELLAKEDPHVVIAESFVQSTGAGATNFGAVEINGVIKLYQQLTDKPIVWQGRQIKNFWDDEKLKTVTLWEKGQKHAMDATRHMLYYLMQVQRIDFYVNRLRRVGPTE